MCSLSLTSNTLPSSSNHPYISENIKLIILYALDLANYFPHTEILLKLHVGAHCARVPITRKAIHDCRSNVIDKSVTFECWMHWSHRMSEFRMLKETNYGKQIYKRCACLAILSDAINHFTTKYVFEQRMAWDIVATLKTCHSISCTKYLYPTDAH